MENDIKIINNGPEDKNIPSPEENNPEPYSDREMFFELLLEQQEG